MDGGSFKPYIRNTIVVKSLSERFRVIRYAWLVFRRLYAMSNGLSEEKGVITGISVVILQKDTLSQRLMALFGFNRWLSSLKSRFLRLNFAAIIVHGSGRIAGVISRIKAAKILEVMFQAAAIVTSLNRLSSMFGAVPAQMQ